ncbi:MAG: hypothetical protein WC404_07265 [Candidatus Omnitrophota bacterium]|jgi:hypothetical protein
MAKRPAPKTAFKKGHPKLPNAGRKKGTPNKFTTLKNAFLNAFQRIGGEDALYEWLTPDKIEYINRKTGKKVVIDMSGDRRKEFFKIMGGMLPKDVQLSGPDGAPLPSQVPVVVFTDIHGPENEK